MNPLNWLSYFIGKRTNPATSSQGAFPAHPFRIAPQVPEPERDQIRAASYAAPYNGPLDLDDYGRETDEMRRQFREFHRKEPVLRSALEGLVGSVADSDIAVIPEDEDHDDDKRAAEFVQWTVDRSSHGWDGLIRNTLLPGLIDGWSVGEPVFQGTRYSRKWGGLWGLEHVKSKDTANLRLRIDAYRNVEGVVNTVRGIATYPTEKVILYTHADTYDNPFGASECRAALRACQLIDASYKLWAFALSAYSGPFLVGKVKDEVRRQALQKALASARANGYIVLPAADEVEVLNLSQAVNFEAFERKIDKLREEIFAVIRGGYLPFMQGTSGGGETRGSAGTSKGAGSDPRERILCKAIGRCLTRQLCTSLVYPNFGMRVGVPRIVLGGTDWEETKAQLEVAKMLRDDFDQPISKRWLISVSQVPPPASEEDAVPPRAQPPALGGGFGGTNQFQFPGQMTSVKFKSGPGFTGTITDSLGRERHYVDGKQVAGHTDDHPQPTVKGPKREPDDQEKSKGGPPPEVSTHDLESLPGLKEHPEELPDARSFATRLHHRIYGILAKADHVALRAMQILPEILDEPDDFKKLGYNPGFSGTDHAGVLDPVKHATGISAHTAASIAVQVMSRAAAFAKTRLRKGGKMSFAQGNNAVDLIAELLDAISEEMGIQVQVDRKVLAATLQKYTDDKGGTGEQPETFRSGIESRFAPTH